MPLPLPNASIAHQVQCLAATLLLATLMVGGTQTAAAHEHDKMCGPVRDGDGEPVLQSDSDIVLHGGSFPCPPEEVDVEAAEPGAPTSVTVYFDLDVAVPNAEGDAALSAIINDLRGLEPQVVTVAGHADRSGPESYNFDLSSRRAENVVERLMTSGVPASAVTTEAYGETRPAVPTEDGVREPANRRAEVDIEF